MIVKIPAILAITFARFWYSARGYRRINLAKGILSTPFRRMLIGSKKNFSIADRWLGRLLSCLRNWNMTAGTTRRRQLTKNIFTGTSGQSTSGQSSIHDGLRHGRDVGQGNGINKRRSSAVHDGRLRHTSS